MLPSVLFPFKVPFVSAGEFKRPDFSITLKCVRLKLYQVQGVIMKRHFLLILLAFCLLFLAGCGQQNPIKSAASPLGSPPDSGSSGNAEEPVSSAEKKVSSLLDSMTPEEKVGQLFFVRCPESEAVSDVKTYHLGGYLLFGRDFRDRTANEIIQTIHAYQEAAEKDTGIPLLIGTDEEGGTVVRVSSNPRLCREKFCSPQQLFAAGGMKKITADTHEKDVLLKALGINVNFAPVSDVSTDPKNFIYARSFGQNAESTAAYVSAVVSQMNDDRMGSVLKHFPGYGNNADTHTGSSIDSRPIKTFQTSDFLPFQAGIRKADGKTAVLVSHNLVKVMDAELPASLSPAVHKILRKNLNFDSVVMTDDLAMDAVKTYVREGDAALLALKAGNDIVLTSDYRTQIPQILSALKKGDWSEQNLNGACRRVLLWKQSLGLLSTC